MDQEYRRTVESSFASGPFRVEWRGDNSGNGHWRMLCNANGAIITQGANPAGCVANLERMAEQMRGICRGLPYRGEKQC
jgi:hypothetical protein